MSSKVLQIDPKEPLPAATTDSLPEGVGVAKVPFKALAADAPAHIHQFDRAEDRASRLARVDCEEPTILCKPRAVLDGLLASDDAGRVRFMNAQRSHPFLCVHAHNSPILPLAKNRVNRA